MITIQQRRGGVRFLIANHLPSVEAAERKNPDPYGFELTALGIPAQREVRDTYRGFAKAVGYQIGQPLITLCVVPILCALREMLVGVLAKGWGHRGVCPNCPTALLTDLTHLFPCSFLSCIYISLLLI